MLAFHFSYLLCSWRVLLLVTLIARNCAKRGPDFWFISCTRHELEFQKRSHRHGKFTSYAVQVEPLHSVTDLLRFRKIDHRLALRVSKRPAPKVFGIR